MNKLAAAILLVSLWIGTAFAQMFPFPGPGRAPVAAGLSCSYTPVTSATQGTAYTGATPSASSGTPSYTFSQTGTLPSGLSISSSTGVISGTPSASGSFTSIQVKVTDSTSTVANCGSAFTLTVAPSGGGCTEATNYLLGLTTSYTTAYTTMICGMVSDGDFSKFERLYVLATDNSTNALKDIITGAAASITGTAAFTANNGYVSTNGTLNTGFNYSTGTKYTQNSAALLAWTTGGATADNGCPIGEAAGAFDIYMQVYSFGGSIEGAVNGGGATAAVASATGLSSMDRSASNLVTNYRDGSSVGTGATTSSTPSNTTAQGFQCAGGTFYNENVAMIGVSGSLGAAAQLRVYNRIHTFLTAVNGTLFP